MGWEKSEENPKLVLGESEATDFVSIWFLTLPFLWFLRWSRLPKAGWLCGLFLLAGQVTNPRTTDWDCVAILQCGRVQLVWFFTICKGTGGERSKQKTLRKQEMEETAELTELPSIRTSLASETVGLQSTCCRGEHSNPSELKLRALDFIINKQNSTAPYPIKCFSSSAAS